MRGSRRRRKRWAALGPFLGVLAFAASPAAAAGQVAAAGAGVTITGRVVDAVTRSPLEGVSVEIVDLDMELRTDSAGEFELRRVPLGTYELSLSLTGYERSSGNLAVVQAGSFMTALEPLSAEATPSFGRLVGNVVDARSGAPLVDAGVHLPELSLGTGTRDGGRFEISSVPPGRHLVEFTHLGYATVRDTVVVVAERTSDVDVRLAVDAIDLAPIEVTVERRELALETAGFYERRDKGWGRFIDLEAIEREDPVEMTDLLDGLNGVTLLHDRFNPLNRYVVLRGGRSGNRGGPCYPKVWLDGTRFHQDHNRPANLDQVVNPTTLAGIEVYPGQAGVPPRYGGPDSTCGVILLWTRQSRGS